MERVGRFFVGVGLPEEARRLLAAVLDRWTGGRPLPGRPVPPENWHLTLRFLGWTDPVALDRIEAALDQADRGPRFEAGLAGLGAFPNGRRASVLWLAVDRGLDRLEELAEVAEEAAGVAGFPAEERPFRPHLTLSRIRPDQDVRPLLAREPPPPLRFEVGQVTLYRSHLGRGGARYEAVQTFDLE